jgi:uncharacterized protein (DUF2062 family)
MQSSKTQSILFLVEASPSISADRPRQSGNVHHGWFYRRFALPIFALLRMGASPQTLAWSVAVGVLIGINPILGSTTLLSLAVASLFRLNIPASQIGTHVVYPLELLLVLPFIHWGTRVFHLAPLPLSAAALARMAQHSPFELVRQLWLWEWHAFLLWLVVAIVMIPLLVAMLTPLLRKLLPRIERGRYPIISAN